MGASGRGCSHGGVRWNTRSRAGWAAISGMNWIADAPVPITATCFPVRSQEWSQREEWNAVPPKESIPGMSGQAGMCSPPPAATTARAR